MSLLSIPCRIPENFLRVALVLVFVLSLTAVAQADGFTITFIDNGDAPTPPSVTISGTNSAADVTYDNCAIDGCTVVLTGHPGEGPTTIPPDFYIAEPGAGGLISDWFAFIPSGNSVVIGFNNVPPIDPVCLVCQGTEGGTIPNVGQITWSDPAIDTIAFQSGAASTVPEPPSFFLCLTGLLGFGIFCYRKRAGTFAH